MNYDVSSPLPFTEDGTDLALTGPEDVAEFTRNEIRIILSTFRNQYRYDLSAGVDWLELFERKPVVEVREAIRAAVGRATFVRNVDRVDTSHDAATRTLSLSFRARLVDGTTLVGSEQL